MDKIVYTFEALAVRIDSGRVYLYPKKHTSKRAHLYNCTVTVEDSVLTIEGWNIEYYRPSFWSSDKAWLTIPEYRNFRKLYHVRKSDLKVYGKLKSFWFYNVWKKLIVLDSEKRYYEKTADYRKIIHSMPFTIYL